MKNRNITILIVDDEPEARDLLSILLSRIEGVKIVGLAENVDHAMLQIVKKEPDLILLDIQMPEKNGFELVSQLRQMDIDIGFIFVTAYDKYAIRAVKESALDYLLKPVDPAELERAIVKFQNERKEKALNTQIDELLSNMGIGQRLKLNTRTGFMLIDPREIVCCIADGNYTEITLASNRKEIISSNLGSLEKELSSGGFFRISRSALINLKYLTKVTNKTSMCRLQGSSVIELKVARNRLGKLEGDLER